MVSIRGLLPLQTILGIRTAMGWFCWLTLLWCVGSGHDTPQTPSLRRRGLGNSRKVRRTHARFSLSSPCARASLIAQFYRWARLGNTDPSARSNTA